MGGFVATLSADQQAAAGLPALSLAERAALDQLVTVELAQVRQRTPDGFTGTFVSRRTEAELKAAGLDRLTPAELSKLNELVAATLAIHPKPKERPRIKDDDVLNPEKKPEIHGSVSLTFGSGGRGRNVWGSSLWLDYFDPASGLGLSVGLSNFSGKGFYGYYPDYYGSRYYASFPVYYDTFSPGLPRNEFSFGDGQSFRAISLGDQPGYGFHRR